MKKNMGPADRAIRLVVALTFAVLYFNNIISGPLGIVLMIASAVFVLTSLVGSCPIYSLLGINTCRAAKK